MKLTGLSWTRYRIPFARQFTNAYGPMPVREGLIVRLHTDEGVVGIGEAAPLPSFGGGSAGNAERVLRSVATLLLGAELDDIQIVLDSLLGRRNGALAVAAALDTAALDAEGKSKGLPVAALLAGRHVSSVPVNITIGSPALDETLEAARRAIEEGFSTVKLKIGLGATPGIEADRVGAVRDTIGPEPALRIDANGIWLPDQAIGAIRAMARYQLELVEQPVAGEELVGLARVRRAVDVPIAADETVTDYEAARRIIESEAADVLIAKPMVLGGPRAAAAIIRLVTGAGLRVVVTTTFDAGVGVAAALHTAATLPEPLPACGLATGPYLETDLLAEPIPICRGRMPLPPKPGLGVEIDEDALARYAAGPEERVGW